MEDLRLCDSEYRFMTLVWEHAPIGSGQLAALCQKELGWKKSTTYTVIKKLCGRGFIQNEHAIVSVLVPMEKCRAVESDYFIERTFGGSLPDFLASFLGSKKLKEEEAEALKRMIDTYRETD